jgi:hypothetical protein
MGLTNKKYIQREIEYGPHEEKYGFPVSLCHELTFSVKTKDNSFSF